MRDTQHDDIEVLLRVLPEALQRPLRALPTAHLLEVVMDLGRAPEARLAERVVRLAEQPVARADLESVLTRLSPVGEDNRTGIEGTLHRISVIRNRRGEPVGLTLRVGRAVAGTIAALRDLIDTGRSLLLLGRPGVGKTTKLREIARVLADEARRRVVVVDTSNEIGGDGDIPHPGIGAARRMQVPRPDRQHAVMIEAVENHMPEVILVDEIGTAAEAAAARTIAERGVQLVATAHGTTLENLVNNPTLADLVGGVHTVTLGDDEARRRGTAKTINERRAAPTFDAVVEMVSRDEVVVHHDTGGAVDRLLAGRLVGGERRHTGPDGRVQSAALPSSETAVAPDTAGAPGAAGPVRLYPYAVSPDLLTRALRDVSVEAEVVDDPAQADAFVALRGRADDARLRRAAGLKPIYTVKRNGSADLRRALELAFPTPGNVDEDHARAALLEAERAVERVLAEGAPRSLAPQPPALRKAQQRVAAHYRLTVRSVGAEPQRHLVVMPAGE